MSRAPLLDAALVRRRRRRSLSIRAGSAVPMPFLFAHAADDLRLRLSLVKRGFERALVAGPAGAPVADWLRGAGTNQVVRLDSVAEGVAPATEGVVADEHRLPFADATFDLVVSAMSLHATDHLPEALAAFRRVLRADGLLLAILFGGDTLIELRRAFLDADLAALGGVVPRVLPTVALADTGALLQRAGFALPVVDHEALAVRYRSLPRLFSDLREMGLTSALRDRPRRPLTRAHLGLVAAAYETLAGGPEARLPATFDLVSLSGWVPHESQQRPLAPGSARARLADALNDRSRIPSGEA